MASFIDAVFNALGIGASTVPPTKGSSSGKRRRSPTQEEPPKKPKRGKIFCQKNVKSTFLWSTSGSCIKAILDQCEKVFAVDSQIYEYIMDVIEEVLREDKALATDEKMSPEDAKTIIQAVQLFIQQRTLEVDDVIEKDTHIAETSADGFSIHLNRELCASYSKADATQIEENRAVAFGTLKFVHEMMYSLTPFILQTSYQWKRAKGVKKAKKLVLAPPRIGTKTEKSKRKLQELGDMGFALEEKISGGRRFFPRFKLGKIGSIQVAERNETGQWIKKSLKKESEEKLIDCILAPKIDFGVLSTLCCAIVETKKEAKRTHKKAEVSTQEDESHEGDEGDEDEGDEGDEEEFPVIDPYYPHSTRKT